MAVVHFWCNPNPLPNPENIHKNRCCNSLFVPMSGGSLQPSGNRYWKLMWRTWNGHISRIQQIMATSTSLGLKIQPRIAWGVHGQHFTIERGTGMNRQNPWKSMSTCFCLNRWGEKKHDKSWQLSGPWTYMHHRHTGQPNIVLDIPSSTCFHSIIRKKHDLGIMLHQWLW